MQNAIVERYGMYIINKVLCVVFCSVYYSLYGLYFVLK